MPKIPFENIAKYLHALDAHVSSRRERRNTLKHAIVETTTSLQNGIHPYIYANSHLHVYCWWSIKTLKDNACMALSILSKIQ